MKPGRASRDPGRAVEWDPFFFFYASCFSFWRWVGEGVIWCGGLQMGVDEGEGDKRVVEGCRVLEWE